MTEPLTSIEELYHRWRHNRIVAADTKEAWYAGLDTGRQLAEELVTALEELRAAAQTEDTGVLDMSLIDLVLTIAGEALRAYRQALGEPWEE